MFGWPCAKLKCDTTISFYPCTQCCNAVFVIFFSVEKIIKIVSYKKRTWHILISNASCSIFQKFNHHHYQCAHHKNKDNKCEKSEGKSSLDQCVQCIICTQDGRTHWWWWLLQPALHVTCIVTMISCFYSASYVESSVGTKWSVWC